MPEQAGASWGRLGQVGASWGRLGQAGAGGAGWGKFKLAQCSHCFFVAFVFCSLFM